MEVLFVHGMGRSPISGWPLLWQLRRAGLKTASLGYFVSIEPFAAIQARLENRIADVAQRGKYILVGHSLGGVLIRAALESMNKDIPPPVRIFLLGSPVMPSRLARFLEGNFVFRALTGDCGKLLASAARMAEISAISLPATSIVGVRGITSLHGPFGGEVNDGVVSLSEVSADWIVDQVKLPVVHGLLPASKLVANIILDRIGPALPQSL